MDKEKLLGQLLMICGCLHDISEMSKERGIAIKISEVELKLENICLENICLFNAEILTN